jgi:phage terminase small subunit
MAREEHRIVSDRTDGLTPKQRRFVAEYLVDLNATQAAIRAGYSTRTARAQGSENLTKPDIAAAVADGQARQLAQAKLTAVATKEAVRRQIDGDIRRLFDEHGNLRPIQSLSAEDAALIAGFDVQIRNLAGGDGHQDTIVKVRLKDQARFVEMAMSNPLGGSWQGAGIAVAHARSVVSTSGRETRDLMQDVIPVERCSAS